jgi:hypothetical protein
MNISVQFSGDDAVTDDERERIHKTGPHTGTFFNSVFIQSKPVLLEKDEENYLNNKYDFTDAYMEAMKELLEQEPRVVEGKALRISIIA